MEKERSLHRRQKALELFSSLQKYDDFEEPTNQKEINRLQIKLDKVREELEYQHSILISLSKGKPIIKKNKFVEEYNKANTNYYQISLQKQQSKLIKKKEELEAKIINARRILSEPLDDTRLDEILIVDIEEDAKLAESKFDKINELNDVENLDFEKVLNKIEKMESNNRIRKKDLLTKKRVLEKEQKNHQLQKPLFVKHSNAKNQQIVTDISTVLKKEKVGNVINSIVNALTERQRKLQAEEQSIDALDERNKQQRVEIERRWGIKVDRIKTQTLQLREIEQMKLAIDSLIEKIENDHQVYENNHDEKLKIQRRIKTILRDKEYNSKKNSEHRELVEKLNQRRELLSLNDEKLQERIRQYHEDEQEVELKEEDMQKVEERVLKIEQEISELQKKNDETISQIQENTAKFEATRIAYASKINNQNSFTFESSVLEKISK
ncbi:hypothetical protein TRFO_28384 [Tritrichomonas foetus]|uniref:DUF4201 domain-containing protein n=1 Tax=Tritrichomonas foetus TaxID=1144522 RepID=A0A1J4JYG9_9EUKA|nr:hypothetical protein TRFO_28384 [Tritrichomonas foetus]|eukprot:OHT04207.1 hypothetical protein TRFO_28384 [Tritrichomonas foetus]